MTTMLEIIDRSFNAHHVPISKAVFKMGIENSYISFDPDDQHQSGEDVSYHDVLDGGCILFNWDNVVSVREMV